MNDTASAFSVVAMPWVYCKRVDDTRAGLYKFSVPDYIPVLFLHVISISLSTNPLRHGSNDGLGSLGEDFVPSLVHFGRIRQSHQPL
jgi:hypothetical protein